MKLNLQTDFTKLARATSIAPAGEVVDGPANGNGGNLVLRHANLERYRHGELCRMVAVEARVAIAPVDGLHQVPQRFEVSNLE